MIKVADIPGGGFSRVEKMRAADRQFYVKKTFAPTAPNLTDDDIEKLERRFHREVRVQSHLDQNFVIPIVSHDLNAHPPHFVMPFCSASLADVINAVPRDEGDIAAALADVLNALEYLHSRGFKHRDVKPHNILFHEGKWKLADFGLVSPESGSTTKLTSMVSGWGSSFYAAPEQITAFGSVSEAVDIYAFGCILHDIFGQPPRVPYQRHTAPGPIGVIIEKCTEPIPSRRFKTVGALRGAVLTFLASAAFQTPTSSAAEWIEKLPSLAGWQRAELESFIHFLCQDASAEDKEAIFTGIEDDALRILVSLPLEFSAPFAHEYCRWTDKSHVFSYCDVVVERLKIIFEAGDTETKAISAIYMAKLGSSHNRWFVMKQLIGCCGDKLRNETASRIAIEIQVEGVQREFLRCADAISSPLTAYHPKIHEVLETA